MPDFDRLRAHQERVQAAQDARDAAENKERLERYRKNELESAMYTRYAQRYDVMVQQVLTSLNNFRNQSHATIGHNPDYPRWETASVEITLQLNWLKLPSSFLCDIPFVGGKYSARSGLSAGQLTRTLEDLFLRQSRDEEKRRRIYGSK